MRTAALILLFLGMCSPALAQKSNQASSADSTLALPTEWETYYVAFLHRSPDTTAAETTPEALRPLMNKHIQYQLQLQADGRAVAAGGVAQDTSASLVGMTLLRAASQEEAERWARDDPVVKAGHFQVEVRAWYVPAGRLTEQ